MNELIVAVASLVVAIGAIALSWWTASRQKRDRARIDSLSEQVLAEATRDQVDAKFERDVATREQVIRIRNCGHTTLADVFLESSRHRGSNDPIVNQGQENIGTIVPGAVVTLRGGNVGFVVLSWVQSDGTKVSKEVPVRH
jgi:hypothetical protein